MKQSKRVRQSMAIVTALALTTALAACGGNNSEENASPSASSSPSATQDGNATQTAEASSAVDPFGKYPQEVTMTWVRSTDDNIEKNILGTHKDWTYENNVWTQLFKEKLNINIKYKWIAKGADQYTQKMNLALASGDLPDFMPVNAIQLKQLSDADLIEDLSDVYDKYASEQTKTLVEEGGKAPLLAATLDGKLKGIPFVYPSLDRTQFLYIRSDWLKKLNLQPPKTIDDVEKIAQAFTTQDPDGNGKPDTFGMGVAKDLFGGAESLKGFAFGFNAYPTEWTEKDGKLVYGGVQPEMKEALAKLQEMYKQGELDKEFGVKDSAKVGEDAASGKFGITYGEHWLPVNPLQNTINNNKDARWQAYPIVSTTGADPKNVLDLGTNMWIAVKKGAKNPEAIVKMLNQVVDAQYGKSFTKELQDNSSLTPLFFVRENNNVVGYKNNWAYFIDKKKPEEIEGTTPDFVPNTEPIKKWMDNQDIPSWGWAYIYGPFEGSSMYVLDSYLKKNLTTMNRFIGAPTATMGDKWAALSEMQLTTFTKIIMGDSLDSFDDFVNQWNKSGGDQITKEVNEWYSNLPDKNY